MMTLAVTPRLLFCHATGHHSLSVSWYKHVLGRGPRHALATSRPSINGVYPPRSSPCCASSPILQCSFAGMRENHDTIREFSSTRTVEPKVATSTTFMADVKSTSELKHPQLVQVPSLPFIGSLVSRLSGIPIPYEQNRVLEFWPAMRAKYGSFYSFGIPGLGRTSHGTVHVIQDPNEMAKLMRMEGVHPSGAAEFAWPMSKYFRDNKLSIAGIVHHGPEWKRIRSFVQTDLLSPSAASRYVPSVLEAARHASRGVINYSRSTEGMLNEYLNTASLDMFSAVMMGDSTRIADPTFESDPDDQRFCQVAAKALRLNSDLMQSPYHALLVLGLGTNTDKHQLFVQNWREVMSLASQKVRRFKQARDAGLLSEAQEASYANQAYERNLASSEMDESMRVNEWEVEYIIAGLFSAGVDTTGGLLSWKLLHLAAHLSVQDTIFDELMTVTKGTGVLQPEHLVPSATPYLHASIRESHRLANPSCVIPMKKFPSLITVHGVRLPAGSVVMLDGYSTGVDPNIVGDDVHEFKPERFLRSAVDARKGTPSEVLDHAFFNGPFSQGARKCPGSRVANYEAVALMAQLILDWKISFTDPKLHWSDVPYDLVTVTRATLPPMTFEPRMQKNAMP